MTAEHVIFKVDDYHIIDNVQDALIDIVNMGAKLPDLTLIYQGGGGIIVGSLESWQRLFASGSLAGAYFIGHFEPEQIRGLEYFDEGIKPDPRVHRIATVNFEKQPADQEVQ